MIADMDKNILSRLAACNQHVDSVTDIVAQGTLKRMVGLKLEAVGVSAPLGAKCIITSSDISVEAEVVGFSQDSLYLMSTENTQGIAPGAKVVPVGRVVNVPVGTGLLGRVIDGAGNPLDGLGKLNLTERYPLISSPINPLERESIADPLDVGIRSINALLTIGRGQRIGLFAGSGVGKSVLLGMMTKFTEADVIVVGLIGERGREVKDFVVNILGESGLKRSVVVAAPADTSPLMRLHGATWATAIAEYFRDQGAKVLLLLDSLTRYGQAQRQIALSIGEPPATKGYPPSVFAKMSDLVERAGNANKGSGSITAFYTVLTEGDDQQDPIADAARAILDGHIVMSRSLAEGGHYPAIDVEASISRAMQDIIPTQQYDLSREFRKYYSHYQKSKDLIAMGAYHAGADPVLDVAIAKIGEMQTFLQQGSNEPVNYQQSVQLMQQLFTNNQEAAHG